MNHFKSAGKRPDHAEQAPPKTRLQQELPEAKVRHQHLLRPQPLCRGRLLRHPGLPGKEQGHVQRRPPAADARVQEQVPAGPLQRGPQHGLGDEEEDTHPLLPVQKVPGGPHEDAGTVQSILHSVHQAE